MKPDILEAVWCEHCGKYRCFTAASIIEMVRCVRCGKLHNFNSLRYFVVSGNITIGAEGGLVGNNLEGDTVVGVAVYCVECLVKYLAEEASIESLFGN